MIYIYRERERERTRNTMRKEFVVAHAKAWEAHVAHTTLALEGSSSMPWGGKAGGLQKVAPNKPGQQPDKQTRQSQWKGK